MDINQPLIVRAAYLHLYFDLFREIGIPYARALARSRLPCQIEEQPNAYVSLPLGLEWAVRTGHDLAPMELGLQASKGITLNSFDSSFRAALLDSRYGLDRIQRFFQLVAIEDSAIVPGIRREENHVRLNMGMPRFDRHPHACLAEWGNIHAVIAVLRSIAGPDWSPKEITLASRLPVPELAFETFQNTRILVGQPCTSVLVETLVLAGPCRMFASSATGGGDAQAPDGQTGQEIWSFTTALRSVIEPYVCEGRADLALAAELVGTSQRTLQRQLNRCGTSYAELVQEVRLHVARTMLSDASVRISDVAMMSGYENPQHFSRAFRRQAGLSPTEYRGLLLGKASSNPPLESRRVHFHDRALSNP